MVRSFDELICYLLEEIALRGEQGAQLPDVVKYIELFYASSNQNADLSTNLENISENVFNIDYSFQQQVWKWLVTHPDCHVEIQGETNNVALSVPEAVDCFPFPPETQILDHSHIGSNDPLRSSFFNLDKSQEATHVSPQSPKSIQRIRVYANEDRIWQTVAGHGVDFSKIPQLDFICLSIIAAAGPTGILQPDLVKISKQDKRSVPRRTQNLYNHGYIVKRPYLTGGSRTSLCVLKRFVQPSADEEKKIEIEGNASTNESKSELIFKKCFPDGKVDLCALSRAIFDILSDLKIIMIEDLKANLGVKGRRWERRVVSMTLRKLEALKCIKQVKAQDETLGYPAKYFRCVKFICEPGERESQLLFGLANVNMRSKNTETVEDSDSEGESVDGDEVERLTGPGSVDDSLQLGELQQLRRPIPQWSGASCVNNDLYDLVHRSGTKGISSMEIKNQMLGKYFLRPVEHQISRIVDFWQISQPLHLRHLAVVRDVAIVAKTSFYVHYSYDNFKKLVNSGEASWEAVMTLEENKKMGKNPLFLLDDQPDIDEYGFPKLQSSLFQGRYNDATLAQCVQALNAKPFGLYRNDLVAYELDGTYEIRGFTQPRSSKSCENPPGISNEMLKTLGLRGRPPKSRPAENEIEVNIDESIPQAAFPNNQSQRQNSLEALTNDLMDRPEDSDRVTSDMSKSLANVHAEAGEKKSLELGLIASPSHAVMKNIELMGSLSYPVNRKRKRCLGSSIERNILEVEHMPSAKARKRSSFRTSNSPLEDTIPSVKYVTQRISKERQVEKEFDGAIENPESRDDQPLPSTALVSKHRSGSPDLVTDHPAEIKHAQGRPEKKTQRKEELKNASRVSKYDGKPKKGRELTYEEQSDLIERIDRGFSVGANAVRARFQGQKGRSKKSRLAIIKSTRLRDFDWFIESEFPSNTELPLDISVDASASIDARSPHINVVQDIERPSDLVRQSESPCLSLDPKISMGSADPEYISPYSDSFTNQWRGIETHTEGVSSNILQDVSISRNAIEPLNLESAKNSANGLNEKPGSPSNDGIRIPHLVSPPVVLSFTPVNHLATRTFSYNEKSGDSSNASNHGTEGSYPNAPNGITKPVTAEKIFPPAGSLATPLHEPLPIAEDTLSNSNNDYLPATDLIALSDETAPFQKVLKSDTTMDQSQILQSVNTTRGSIGILRRNIILDIIQICDGVYSSPHALIPPFITAWQKLNKPGRPDGRTVQVAYRSLVNSGRLRELKFSFQDSHGLMVIKPMITDIGIDPTDARVKEVQEKMIACHPHYFIPENLEIPEENRHRVYFPSHWMLHRCSADIEIDDETQVRLQHKPGYVIRKENRKTMSEKKQAERKVKDANRKLKKRLGRKEHLETDPTETLQNQRCNKDLVPARTVERLASIRRPINKDVLDFTMHQVDGFSDPFNDYPDQSSSAETDFASENIGNLSRVDRDYLTTLKDSYDAVFNTSGLRKRRHRHDETFKTSHEARISLPRNIKRLKSTETHHKKLQQTSTIMNPNCVFHSSSGTFSVSFSGFESPDDESANLPRKRLNNEKKARLPNALPRHSTFMDPDHVYHPSSGTFSVTFSGFDSLPQRHISTIRGKPDRVDRVESATYHGLMQQLLTNHKQVYHPPSGTISTIFTGYVAHQGGSTNKFQRRGDEGLKTAFEMEIDDLMGWGPVKERYLTSDYSNWPFINYGMKHYRETPNHIQYRLERPFGIPLPDTNSIEPSEPTGFLVFPRIPVTEIPLKKAKTTSKTNKMKRKRKRVITRLELKSRQLTAPTIIDEIGSQDREEYTDLENDENRPIKVRKIRGPHKQIPITPEEEERLLAAVIVIRTLLGGVDKNIDWVLVSRLFQPAFSQMYIQNRWKHVMYRFRLQIDQIQAKFQSKFSKAYEDNIIPPIDFDNVEDYDWAWLVDWTMENIDTSADALNGLPAQRLDLDEQYDLQVASDNEMLEFYEIDCPSVTSRRDAVLNRRSYVYLSEPTLQSSLQTNLDEVEIAKTWIRANVITSEASYDSSLARTKLSLIGEANVDIALQELLRARLLSHQNKGRLVPGRNYDISDFFLSRMRKKLDASQFYRAVAFKRQLDHELMAHSSAEFSYTAENGDLLVVLNLLAHQRISIRAKNPPMEKFGLLDKGYITRRMDKSRLEMDIEIRMERDYVMGTPLLPLRPPPCQHLENPMAKIPIWYDIHGRFVPIMWEMALAATILILAIRPGATASEIAKSVRPTLGAWELDLILEWMVQVKAGKKVGLGYSVEEWWWMCLGDGQVLDQTTPAT